MLTLDFQVVNEPLQQEIIPNLLTQVYPNTYNHSHKDYNFFFLSLKVYDYKSMPNVWINEARMCLKLYKDCILEYKLNGRVVINLVWILMSLFIVGAEKLVITDCLPENGSLLTING